MDCVELAQLIRAAATNDRDAFARFYDLTIGKVYGLALRITCREDEAEEVVGDVYLQVWQQAHTWNEGRGNVMAWLMTVCRSRALDRCRRRDRAKTGQESTDDVMADAREDDMQDLLVATENESILREALNSLNHEQRDILQLSYYRGYSHQNIADYMGMPLGSVKSHIRNSLKKLKTLLKPVLKPALKPAQQPGTQSKPQPETDTVQ